MPPRIKGIQRLALLLAVLGLSAGYAALGLILVLATAIWEGISTRRVPWQRGAVDAPFLSFVLAFLLSGLFSPYRTTALGAWVLAVLTLYVGYGLLHRFIALDPGFLIPLLRTWVIGGTAAAVWGTTLTWGTNTPAYVPEMDQNMLATALIVAFFIGLWFFFTSRSASRVFTGFGLVAILVTLTLTTSRGAWVGLIAALVAFLVLAGRRVAARALLLVAIVGMATSMATGPHPLLLRRFQTVTSAAANRDRIALAESAIALFRNRPLLGFGLNTFSLVHLDHKPADAPDLVRHSSAHNIFLNMAAEGGTLGGASFVWIVLAGLLAGLRWVRGTAAVEERLAGVAVVAAFIGVLINQMFDATILAANLGVGFWFLIGIQAARARTFSADSPDAREPSGMAPGRPSVLVVSNGYGEDAAGMALARALGSTAGIAGFPLVGAGNAYTGLMLLDPHRQFPSGGFGLRGSWRALWEDVRAGAVRHWLAQRRTLRGQRGRWDAVVAIGDVYCLWMAAAARTPVVFVATAKSEYNEPHRRPERILMRRHAQIVFTRDQPTTDALRRAGITARYVGNVLMDTVDVPTAIRSENGPPTVALLPGSRADAYGNVPLLLQVCQAVSRRVRATFVCALAPSIDLDRVRETARSAGWTAAGNVLQRDGVGVKLTHGFGEAVAEAKIVIGLAGTANEQAAGLGRPVVAFPTLGAQFNRRFLNLQQRLLGDALVATRDWQDAADAVVRLLHDPAERTRRGEIGRQRMGEPGAVKRIAEEIIRMLTAG